MTGCTFRVAVVAILTAAVGVTRPAASADPPSGDGAGYRVKSAGEMRNVMQKGDLSAHFDLATLKGMAGLYALGPVAGLQGEVVVLDGQPAVTTLVDGKPAVSAGWPKACFLVYAQVRQWDTQPVPPEVRSLGELEPFVLAAAKRAGLDVGRPFPFLLTGAPASVKYHVVWKTDGLPHTRELHQKAKVPFEVQDREVRMLGFWSDRHQGVFTHHDSTIHVHVRTADGRDAGHVDAATFTTPMTLHLPRP